MPDLGSVGRAILDFVLSRRETTTERVVKEVGHLIPQEVALRRVQCKGYEWLRYKPIAIQIVHGKKEVVRHYLKGYVGRVTPLLRRVRKGVYGPPLKVKKSVIRDALIRLVSSRPSTTIAQAVAKVGPLIPAAEAARRGHQLATQNGQVYSLTDALTRGRTSLISMALCHLAKQGHIRRISKGVYGPALELYTEETA